MKQHQRHTWPPPSSNDNSDSEDLYEGSDGLLSDEDHVPSLSASPLPAYFATLSAQGLEPAGKGEDDDEIDADRNLPSFFLSSQDFDQRLPLCEEENRVQDDFLLIETSDLESIGRPHSSLSNHSDHNGHDDSMDFIYPSMVLSYSSVAPVQYDSQDDVDKASVVPEYKSHIPLAQGDDATAMRNLSGMPASTLAQPEVEELKEDKETDLPSQDWTDDATPLSGTMVLSPEPRLAEDNTIDQGDVHGIEPANNGVPLQRVSNSPAVAPSEITVENAPKDSHGSNSSSTQSSVEIKTLFDRLSSYSSSPSSSGSNFVLINPSWNLANVVAGTIGFLMLLLLTGYLSAAYSHHSTRPAHVVVSEINYSEYSNPVAVVVNLHVFTPHHEQVTRPARPPGFHVRVLSDDKPWKLEEAPSQPLDLFMEPVLTCTWGGWCHVDIVSLKKQTHKNQSPWLCSDTSYYLHVWFANGTRISDMPPEIFTSRGEGGSKPHACSSEAKNAGLFEDQGTPDDSEDNYLAYWMGQLRHMTNSVTERCSDLSATWADQCWDRLLPVIVEMEKVFRLIVAHSQQCGRMLIDAAHQLSDQLFQLLKAEDTVLEQVKTVLMRARENAKKIKGKASLAFDDHQGKFLARSMLQKADQVFVRAEEMLTDMEEGFDSWVRSDTVQKMVKKVPVNVIMQHADRLALGAEARVNKILDSEFAHGIHHKLQQNVKRFKTTPAGKKLIREAHAVQKDLQKIQGKVGRSWRDLQKQFLAL
ncbi:hypothetical protein BGZ65_006813 [Modicella reniformis]|uniref:Uncharacterized protein n=1 Tax=Modicella reniformis TaxID=1440133 RepID=A0A9P6SV04_9FUNG|nr:hypothetical protein BGZ65_006813 [Modicella reniformis]